MATKPQWEPDSSVLADTSMAHFTRQAEARFGLELDDYSSLHQWSVDQPEHFWGLLWDYMGVISSQPYECVVKDVAVMPGAKWFPGARLNFAENLLVSRECELAVVFRGERGKRTTLSGEELYQAASRMAK
ncbi:MAG: acetyl-coenzyme A synthetase N-terminal domain-containing protein, partial [Arenicellales bacterium]|nr:acetyl-coenzyme A synthetase N-terminal domain-containing protein [Arenicellales bacterium]